MTTHRVEEKHVKNWCSKGHVKTQASFSRIQLHAWAVVTTFHYGTSYTLFQPSGTSHVFSDQNYFHEYLRIAMRLMIEILFTTRSPHPAPPQPATAQVCDGGDPGLLPALLQQEHWHCVWFPWPWNTSTEVLNSPSSNNKAEYNILNGLSSSGIFTTTGSAWTQLPSFS